MKNSSIPSLPLLGLLLLSCVLSCTTQVKDIIPNVRAESLLGFEVKSINGLLVLKSRSDFYTLTENLNRLKSKDRILLEKKLNFKSLKTASENEELEALSTDLTIQQDNKISLHPFCASLSSTLDKDGLVVIGGQLMSFSQGMVKSIALRSGFNLNQAKQLINSTTTSDKKRNIFVSEVKTLRPKSIANARSGDGQYSIISPPTNNHTFWGINVYRLEGIVSIYTYYTVDQHCDSCANGPGDMLYDSDCDCYFCGGCLSGAGIIKNLQITATAYVHVNGGLDNYCQRIAIGSSLSTDFTYISNSSVQDNPGGQLSYFAYNGQIPTTSDGMVSGNITFGCIYGPGQSQTIVLSL
jgi:hypothetical protein